MTAFGEACSAARLAVIELLSVVEAAHEDDSWGAWVRSWRPRFFAGDVLSDSQACARLLFECWGGLDGASFDGLLPAAEKEARSALTAIERLALRAGETLTAPLESGVSA